MTGLFGELLPESLTQEAWDAYCEWRDSAPKGKRWTKHARKLILDDCFALEKAGENVTACVNQSIKSCWTGVFPVHKPKQSPFTALPANDAVNPQVEATRRYLASREMDPEEIKAAARRARELFARRA